MWAKIFPKRFSVLKAFVLLFLFISFLVRLSLFLWAFNEVDKNFSEVLRTFFTGLFFDIGTISFFTIPYLIYLMILPNRWVGSILDKSITFFGFFLGLFIIYFSFLGEFTFWEEFQRRYNFIAVDYLVYTYEVVKNINESYPLPILISILLLLVFSSLYLVVKLGLFKNTFHDKPSFKSKLNGMTPWVLIMIFFSTVVTNQQSEWSLNTYNNELSKAGIYSFFAAFRNNELSYKEFYPNIDLDKAFDVVQADYIKFGDKMLDPGNKSIYRGIHNTDSLAVVAIPNVIFICIESLSGKFMNALGGDQNITPVLDSLANESIFFTNLYATGTRTVRGMEAITLSIPPTPGSSIVKRQNNRDLFTIGEVFKVEGYERNFFYGGDGYFDNMNTYFGGNGFNIVDRGRGFLLDTSINTKRTNIEDSEVTFENAWGVCDQDVYNKVIMEADKAHASGTPFFDFVMTTSNHKPYTYPEGKIDIPSGTGRNGAVKYTDFAIGEFLKMASTKPWYKNTVFVIMSDHCANSAGKGELDVQNFHIPAMIFNAPNGTSKKVNTLCSQIDIFPTLFGLLNWDYSSNLFGYDIFKMTPKEERAFIGNYRKLGYLKGNKVLVLGDQETANFYSWNPLDNSLKALPMDNEFLEESISFYQVADYLYHNDGLKLKQ
ncbi:LTA synthase family protein [Sediminicola arcticus]|jgi:phosphoglycerol transferase MdoB-like AlkP superfamily enzyme|uniref:LTA synthase family protein n=1 Tax=Sediminicola arcticus TaxID=1574308 RepID=A0ABV2SWY5_9FLAO